VDHRVYDGLRPLSEPGDERPYTDEELRVLREDVFPLAVQSDWRTLFEGERVEPIQTSLDRSYDAFLSGDVDAVLAMTSEDVVISQPEMLPGARTYRGRRGVVEAYLDWPLQWERLEVEPKQAFIEEGPGGEQYLFAVGIHRGLSKIAGIEVAAEITWLMTYRNGLMARWTMHTSLDDARASIETGT
jgi:ketosteroid isomerase-like protein